MEFSRLPIRSVGEHELNPIDRAVWPATLPPVAALLDGVSLGSATVLVGENGSGKSTLVEAIALAYGLSPEGGSVGARYSTRRSESQLWDHLQLVRNAGATKRGYFLRAETMHGLFTYLEQNPGNDPVAFHERSHGESFIDLVEDRFRYAGLWVLDEPESALSFSGCLALLSLLKSKLDDGRSQIILSTHSPVLAALPGATVYEVGEWGLRERAWMDLPLVDQWTRFLLDPAGYLEEL